MAVLRKLGPVRFVPVAFLASCVLTVACGIYQLALFPREQGASDIGKSIAKIIDGATVVGDHNGFRFSGYLTSARFRFFQENDPEFPAGLFETVKRDEPDFVLVTDTYKPLSKTMRQQFGNYERIAEYTYTHPQVSFGEVNNTQRLSLFRRR